VCPSTAIVVLASLCLGEATIINVVVVSFASITIGIGPDRIVRACVIGFLFIFFLRFVCRISFILLFLLLLLLLLLLLFRGRLWCWRC